MAINPQQQQQQQHPNNNSINYQITTGNTTTTYQSTLNGGNIGSAIIAAAAGGGGGGGVGANIIGTINNPINNLVNMNLTTVSAANTSTTNLNTNTNIIANNQNNSSNNNALSLCCLIENGTKCTRNAGNASYSKRIEKQVAQRKLQLIVDPRSSHAYICEHHKQIIQSIRTSGKRKRKDGGSVIGGHDDGLIDDELSLNDFNGINDSSNEMITHSITSTMNINSSLSSSSTSAHQSHHHMNNSGKYGSQQHHHQQHQQQQQQQQQQSSYTSSSSSSPIDFHSLQVNTLRKYKRHFRLPIKHASNKNQLADEIQRHFRALDVNEKDVINKFMYMVKNGSNNNNSNNNNNGKSNEFSNSKE
ncbi:sap30-like protein [Dermatophagoides farinae]|uniref:Sap30-like protein n=1 Tax=Dermatophagoides farinae TaxID=6954 RepID=A0A9D4SKM9_DERFA|nr:histone deacetylase complex subunit SAP30-like [Dermatophagoides farinae]KAH7645473.1 sap30-like protein [Dermatophagoides farinae]